MKMTQSPGIDKDDPKQDLARKGWLCRILKSQWTAAVFVLFVALTVRMLHIRQAVQSPLMNGDISMSDSRYYDKVAREVAEGNILGSEVFFMAPLYPYAMAIPYRMFRTEAADGSFVYDIAALLYLQCVLGAVSCLLMYWVASLMMGRGVGLLAGLIAAAYGVFVYYDGIIMPSSLILFLHLLALLTLLLAARYGLVVWWIISGLLLGLCAVAHGTAMLVLVGVLLWVWLSFAGVDIRTKLIRTVLVLAGFVLIIGVVTVRNYIVGKDFVLLTSNVGKNLYIGNNPTATGSFEPYVFDFWGSGLGYYLFDIKRGPQDLRPSESSRRLVEMAVDFMLKHPLRETQLLIKKFCLFFNSLEVGINDNYHFAKNYSAVLRWLPLSFGVVGPVGLIGLFYNLRQWRKHFLLLVFIVSQVISFTIVFVLGRYRLVFVACLIPFAAAQLVWWWTKLRQKQYRQGGGSILVLVLMVFWVNQPITGFNKNRGLGQQYAQVAETYLLWGELENAREALEKATRADFAPWGDCHFQRPSCFQRVRCYLELGEVYERLQNHSAAVEAYEEVLSMLRFETSVDAVNQKQDVETRLRMLQEKME